MTDPRALPNCEQRLERAIDALKECRSVLDKLLYVAHRRQARGALHVDIPVNAPVLDEAASAKLAADVVLGAKS